MEYAFGAIERKWKKYWQDNHTYRVSNDSELPKFYILDMFPYPSGAGLHVGHPLGYIASDIYARYKRLKGFNVLHPMGFDAFGLPAEQYALETGQHPAVTTEKNIAHYREQLDNIGFCYDWEREVRTSDAKYYKWTQWIFLQLFDSWYDRKLQKARPMAELVKILEKEGNNHNPCPEDSKMCFDARAWKDMTEKERRDTLMRYRLAYQGYAEVWWCEALGTVLANDEVVNGVSERGGHPVERKRMRQWFLRITEYAERLLASLDTLDWSEAMKEMQRNWIGRSTGAEVRFDLHGYTDAHINVFTTRPDTIFGSSFVVLAPEHELVDKITTPELRQRVQEYKDYVKTRSERERQAEVKQITGTPIGAYVQHPFTRELIPVWISEYVLAGYGTGAIMAVPSGDERDHAFAKHFGLPIPNIFGNNYNGQEAYTEKQGKLENSDFLNGLDITKATDAAVRAIEDAGIGHAKVNYRLRDAGFSRQRYWGEPFPIIYLNEIPYAVNEEELHAHAAQQQLPVELPLIENYKPGPEGEGPLANVTGWVQTPAGNRETNTMPGYAGSSWYFLRYMDPNNDTEFASRNATDYWREVDIYIGGTEHAVGHLLYSRMWTKALFDLGHIGFEEPFKKLVNQGMIQGVSQMIRIANAKTTGEETKLNQIELRVEDGIERVALFQEAKSILYSANITPLEIGYTYQTHIPIQYVSNNVLDIPALVSDRQEYEEFVFACKHGYYLKGKYFPYREDNNIPDQFFTSSQVEKMSKSKYNVVNPDDIVAQYGADTFRMYEMFLGPIDVSKPWDTKGIEGVHRFLKKLWRLYMDEQKGWIVTEDAPTEAELRIIHKTIKKTGDDIERFSFNTAVSQFMICVNELSTLGCHKRDVLEALAVILAPFAPHLAEELWQRFGHERSVAEAVFPAYDEAYLVQNTKKYPVAVNGKPRVEMEFALDMEQGLIEQEVLADATIQKWLDGKAPKKFIYVKGKMINVVV